MDEASSHPHLKARQTYVDMSGANQPGPNPRFSVTKAAAAIALAELGQHSRQVLADWGIPLEAVDDLCRSNVVFQLD
ncbi:MAG: hypothetical protein J0G36_07805 [Afipia sp.]|nr:hypothetical protein [Afipia sp.]